MSGGYLDTNAGFALGNDGIRKAYDVDPLFKHGVGKARGEGGVTKHNGHDGVLSLDDGKATFRHASTEVANVAFETVPEIGRLLEEIESGDGSRHDGWSHAVGKKIGSGTLTQKLDDFGSAAGVSSTGAAQGFASLSPFASIAGEQAASRYARNRQAATARVEEDLPAALFVDLKQTTASSTFGPYDLAFNVFVQKPSDSLAKLAAPVTRFLVDGQRPDGSWRTTSRSKSLISSSMQARSKVLPEYTGRGFDWAQAWVLPARWNNSYYPTPAGIVPTSYAMLALSNAMEYALEPEEVTSTEEPAQPDEIPPPETQEKPESSPDQKPAPQPE